MFQTGQTPFLSPGSAPGFACNFRQAFYRELCGSVASKGCQVAERFVGEVFSTKEISGPVEGVVPFMVRFMLSAVQIEVK